MESSNPLEESVVIDSLNRLSNPLEESAVMDSLNHLGTGSLVGTGRSLTISPALEISGPGLGSLMFGSSENNMQNSLSLWISPPFPV